MAFSFRIGTNWCHDFPKLARESGFYFNMHSFRARIDWNRISNIDIDRVIRERDFSTIDENLNNVIAYTLESEYDLKILDPTFVKLFRLAQLAVEYLLYCKQYLDHSVVILKDELKQKIEENVKLKKELTASEEVIKCLKEKSKERGRLIETKIGNCNGEIYKCPHCPKTFISAMFVNAHVARRHTYVSDLSLTSSPLHEHYRTETEKLHNEIKTLKERLNQAERVIRNESEKVPNNTNEDYKIRLSQGDTNKSLEHKGYQDEIINLKTMLFDEIHNLRQKDKSIYEHLSETSVQALINQQEKEFQKLRNQLFEKLTPDIESVHTKLHAQEDYWKSKIDQLEQQHHKDVEKLTTELKLAQETADHLKAEYESKVSDLERQSINQSNILLEQSKQLHSLSRERNDSKIQRMTNAKNHLSDRSSNPAILQYQSDFKQKFDTDSKTEQIIVEDVESVSSLDSTQKLISASQNRITKGNIPTLNHTNKIAVRNNRNAKQLSQNHIRNSKEAFEMVLNMEKKILDYDSTDMSELQTPTKEKQSSYKMKHAKDNLHDEESIKDSRPDEFHATDSKDNLEKNMIQAFSMDMDDRSKPSVPLEDDLTSETRSVSVTLNSQTESDSESITTIRNSSPRVRKKASSMHLVKLMKTKKNGAAYKKLQMDLEDMFHRRLRELGIDPEWQGIPKATFKQKMDILKHHQSIATKKLPRYHEIKLKIIKTVLDKISKRGMEEEPSKSKQKSPSNKSRMNVKSVPVETFNNNGHSDGHSPSLKIQDTISKKVYLKPKDNSNPNPNRNENIESIKNSSILPKDKSQISNSYDGLQSIRKNLEILGFSPSSIQPQKDTKSISNSRQTLTKNSHDSLNKIKPISDTVQQTITSSPSNKGTISINLRENTDLDDSKMAQDLQVSPSPKSNKSALKSVTGSASSMVKKKVIFDLTNDYNERSPKEEELQDSDWNSSSLSDDETGLLKKPEYGSSSNIILKTSQSDKIAEISRKLEEQLNAVRQKPVGSVETMFSSMYIQSKENHNDKIPEKSTSSIISLLDNSDRMPATTIKTSDPLPQPAPRNLTNKMYSGISTESISEDSDLDSDIDKILKLD